MNNAIKPIIAGVSVAVLLFLFVCFFTITQGQHAIVLRLGKIVSIGSPDKILVLPPGIHFKYPFIETIRTFDTRIQTLDIKSSRIVTKEKKDVMVDYYVKWRINNLSRYFKATSGIQFKAETLLEQQLNTLLRSEFGKRTISDVVTGGRDDVMDVLRGKAEAEASKLGLHVVDVRIKGIELPSNTSNAIYQRMRADMQKIANRHRADGQASAEAIQAEADAAVVIAIETAKSEGESIKAEGQAKAAAIYANAFGQNKDFFVFYRSLMAYANSFSSKNDVLILDQNNAFLSYFNHGVASNKANN